jgi:hypothetical protein
MASTAFPLALEVLKVLGGYIIGRLQDFLARVKPLAFLMGDARNNASDCFILLGSYETITPGFRAHTFHGPITIRGPQQNMEIDAALAFAHIRALLAAAGKTERIVVQLAYQNPGAVVDQNTIAISGPGSNYRVGQIFETYSQTFFKIAGDNNDVIRSDGGEIEVRNTKHYDHGILLKLQNQNNKQNVVFVAAGLGEQATAGAGYALWRFRRDLVRRFGRSPFGVVVRVDTRQGYQSAQIIHFAPRLRWYQKAWPWVLSFLMK